ncbi:MAG: hypothetical protein IH840_08795 [Candidatus Heimdallarchaeota archaeon]|nr:hypothetical protein [Candidatus Heimdallarchaeota archaeon]
MVNLRSLFDQEKFDEVIEAIDKIDNPTPEMIILLGRSFYFKGEFDTALGTADKFIDNTGRIK